ncbi:MAG: UDP-N-acetylmuramoyl-L-alanine--D-glutamate ligase [Candidatus Moranbacteria bacterium]|nr:UDP-N-acetylmuramoyl-L-alanine--D-glutamate ligase [Candidatus Moranbacteria bacterium]
MKREDLKGKRVTVFGLGTNEGGIGTVEFLERCGVGEIVVTDRKDEKALQASLDRLSGYDNITYALGRHREEDFIGTDLVVKNPGIPWNDRYVRLAESHGIPVEMDSGIFFENCDNRIVGVTGTKGKTTTASMIVHILRESGKGVVPVGISQAPVLGAFDRIRPDDIVVFELSSWRLSALGRICRSPEVAVFTNFFPDHLNYYVSIDEYRDDKRNLYAFQKEGDVVIADAGLDFVRSDDIPSEKLFFGRSSGDDAFFDGERAVLRREGIEIELFRSGDIAVPGSHARTDALAAATAAFVCGVPAEKIAAALRSFPGVPHRLEQVGEIRGVKFFNDSAATVPEAALAALSSFEVPVIHIAGGSDKNLDFGPLADGMLRMTRAAVLLPGTGTDRLLSELSAGSPEAVFSVEPDMESAVRSAFRLAEPGDVVLLSPGAASFGLFRNEFDRGERFRDSVEGLKADLSNI